MVGISTERAAAAGEGAAAARGDGSDDRLAGFLLQWLRTFYASRHSRMLGILDKHGFKHTVPDKASPLIRKGYELNVLAFSLSGD